MSRPKSILLALLTLASGSIASALTINFQETRSQAYDGLNSTDSDSVFSFGVVTSTDGASQATHTTSLSGSGDNVSLTGELTGVRGGVFLSYAYALGFVQFTVDSNTTFALSGSLTANDTVGGREYFYMRLLDTTANTTLFSNLQESRATVDESFVLGQQGGDFQNQLIGSASGNLVVGHQYQWYYEGFTQAFPTNDSGGTNSGSFRLDIGTGAPSSVPDSGSNMLMVSGALLGLVGLRRRYSR